MACDRVMCKITRFFFFEPVPCRAIFGWPFKFLEGPYFLLVKSISFTCAPISITNFVYRRIINQPRFTYLMNYTARFNTTEKFSKHVSKIDRRFGLFMKFHKQN